MAVKISHAVCSENNSKYGKLGDQTTKEVRFDNWYNGDWNVVLRPKDSKRAERIAVAMEQAAKNEQIGYTQSQRITLYVEAIKVGFDLSKIETVCGCDCSSLVAVAVNAAGITVSRDIYTGNMVKALMATGEFEKYIAKQYLKEESYLKRGDILVHEGSHTAVVLTNGDKVDNDETTKKEFGQINCTVIVTAFWLNVRSEASSKSKIVKTLKKNTKVHITRKNGDWGYSAQYKGWLNLTYTKTDVSQLFIDPYVAITTTTVNFRMTPNSSNSKNIITKFNRGQYLLITTERSDGWAYGKTVIDGVVKSGWIYKDYIQKVNYNTLRRRRVIDVTGLNIRTSGNSKSSCIGTIPFNKEFYVIEDGNWGVVIYVDVLGYSNLSNSYSEKVFDF